MNTALINSTVNDVQLKSTYEQYCDGILMRFITISSQLNEKMPLNQIKYYINILKLSCSYLSTFNQNQCVIQAAPQIIQIMVSLLENQFTEFIHNLLDCVIQQLTATIKFYPQIYA